MDCYETQVPLNQVAQVSVRDPNCLTVGIYDQDITNHVQKAISNAGLNLNPVIETKGRLKIPIPKANAESREATKKVASKEAENARITVRNVRRDVMKVLKTAKAGLPEDDFRKQEQAVESITRVSVAFIDKLIETKLKSLST